MRLDYKKWTDIYSDIRDENSYTSEGASLLTQFKQNKPLTTPEGYLTDFAKELMTEFKCYTLEDLLTFLEGSGKGYFFKDETGRPDVNLKGHNAEVLWGNTFRSTQE